MYTKPLQPICTVTLITLQDTSRASVSVEGLAEGTVISHTLRVKQETQQRFLRKSFKMCLK